MVKIKKKEEKKFKENSRNRQTVNSTGPPQIISSHFPPYWDCSIFGFDWTCRFPEKAEYSVAKKFQKKFRVFSNVSLPGIFDFRVGRIFREFFQEKFFLSNPVLSGKVENNSTKMSILGVLGQGNFGQVFKGKWTQGDGREILVALKKLLEFADIKNEAVVLS
jgi:hypothetical protein